MSETQKKADELLKQYDALVRAGVSVSQELKNVAESTRKGNLGFVRSGVFAMFLKRYQK